jgi:hypothetical protein
MNVVAAMKITVICYVVSFHLVDHYLSDADNTEKDPE